MEIGSWVKRPAGRWHLVERVVNYAAITRCNRRLEWEVGDGVVLKVRADEPDLDRCKQC